MNSIGRSKFAPAFCFFLFAWSAAHINNMADSGHAPARVVGGVRHPAAAPHHHADEGKAPRVPALPVALTLTATLQAGPRRRRW
jgi:hypothetical protein